MQEAAIVFEDVWKSYPSYYHVSSGIKGFLFNIFKAIKELRSRRSALEGLSFTIYKGENFGIIGHNGAGKSTTLGLIAGVLAPNKGHIQVNDRVSPLLELGTGFHPELSGRANILLNGVLLGLTREEVLAHEQDIIDFADLGDFIDMPVRTYSSGMYAKLGFAVVTTLKPKILLLDEILSVGDITFQHKCKKVFEKFRHDPEVTTVLVSHSLGQIRDFCDRVAWIENKTLKMIGPAAEVIKAYEEANQITSPVSTLEEAPSSVGVTSTILNCSNGPASFSAKLFPLSADNTLHIKLFHTASARPQEWQTSDANFTLLQHGAQWTLTADGTPIAEIAPSEEPRQRNGAIPPGNVPLGLSITGVNTSGAITPPVWLAVCPTAEAHKNLKLTSALKLAEQAPESLLPPFLWQSKGTIRIIARNIVPYDAVSNFAIGIAGALKSMSISACLYAYVFSQESAGIVNPIASLHTDIEPGDTIFYNYSIEDEFFPHITSLQCAQKILYYHNVTPGNWFREYNTDFADILDRSREQFPLFTHFSSVLANSNYSLNDVIPHILPETPRAVFPPSMNLNRLIQTRPEPIFLPDVQHKILWVGRMAPHKRPSLALDIFQQLSDITQNCALIMVGGGRRDFPQFASQLEQQIAMLPASVRDRVLFLEGLTDGQLAYLYSTSSLLLSTSGHEGYCLPIKEAMSFHLPVAALRQPAVEEVLHGYGHLLPEDKFQAAKRLYALLEQR